MNTHRLVPIPLDLHEEDGPDRDRWRCVGCGAVWPASLPVLTGCPALDLFGGDE